MFKIMLKIIQPFYEYFKKFNWKMCVFKCYQNKKTNVSKLIGQGIVYVVSLIHFNRGLGSVAANTLPISEV